MNFVQVYNTDTNELLVNARELYDYLEIKDEFSHWIKDKIGQCDLDENSDYFLYKGESLYLIDFNSENTIREKTRLLASQKVETRGRPQKDYLLTLDSAKELAMVSKSEKSKEIRKYFIACEKRLRLIQQEEKQLSYADLLEREAEKNLRLAAELRAHEALKQRIERGTLFDELNRVTDQRPVISIKRIREEYFLGFSDHAVQTFLRYINHPKRIEKVKNIPNEMYIDENLFEAAQRLWDECEKIPRPRLLELKHSCFLNRAVYMDVDTAIAVWGYCVDYTFGSPNGA